MAKVWKRTRNGEFIGYQVCYRDRDGKRRAKLFQKKADADAYLTKVRSELMAGTHVAEAASITVQEAGQLWISRGDREGLEAGTLRQYRQHLNLHIVPLIGDRKISTLTAPAVEAFKDRLLETRSRPLARAILTSLKGILQEAVRLGKASFNAAESVKINRRRRSADQTDDNEGAAEIPSKDEIRAVLAKSAELWPLTKVQTTRKREQKVIAVPWRPFVVTAVFTGMRCSELRGLTWDHVDFDAGIIRIRQRADFQNTMGPPKTEAGKRDIPMSPMVLNTLRQWKLACPRTALNLVFPTENGLIHSNSNIHKQCWGPLQLAAGIVEQIGAGDDGKPILRPRLTFHSLRHAAASLFIEQGWTPKKVQAVMGHSSIQVTFDTYGHLWTDAESDRDAMAQIEARLLA